MASVNFLTKPVPINGSIGFGSLSADNSPQPEVPQEIEFTDELISGLDPNKTDVDLRIKRKAKRPSRSVELPEDVYVGTGTLSASLPSHFTFDSTASRAWNKKHSKNSRRSRRGRGLTKKGLLFVTSVDCCIVEINV
jgi:hypothetical protein